MAKSIVKTPIKKYDFKHPNKASKRHKRILKYGSRMFSDWLKLAKDLQDQRDDTDHGDWQKYVENELPWSYRTVAKWLQVRGYIASKKSVPRTLLNYTSWRELTEYDAEDEVLQAVLDKAEKDGKPPTKKQTLEIIESFEEDEEDEKAEEDEKITRLRTKRKIAAKVANEQIKGTYKPGVVLGEKDYRVKERKVITRKKHSLGDFVKILVDDLNIVIPKLNSLVENIENIPSDLKSQELFSCLKEIKEYSIQLYREMRKHHENQRSEFDDGNVIDI